MKEFLNSSDSGNRLVLTPSQRRIRGYLQDAVLQTFRTQVVTEVEVDSQGERSVVVEKCGSDAEVKEKYQKILAAEMVR